MKNFVVIKFVLFYNSRHLFKLIDFKVGHKVTLGLQREYWFVITKAKKEIYYKIYIYMLIC